MVEMETLQADVSRLQAAVDAEAGKAAAAEGRCHELEAELQGAVSRLDSGFAATADADARERHLTAEVFAAGTAQWQALRRLCERLSVLAPVHDSDAMALAGVDEVGVAATDGGVGQAGAAQRRRLAAKLRGLYVNLEALTNAQAIDDAAMAAGRGHHSGSGRDHNSGGGGGGGAFAQTRLSGEGGEAGASTAGVRLLRSETAVGKLHQVAALHEAQTRVMECLIEVRVGVCVCVCVCRCACLLGVYCC